MKLLLGDKTKYLQHYENLVSKYDGPSDIIVEGFNFVKEKIRSLATKGHSKFSIYVKLNPDLKPSPFLHIVHPMACDIIRFRVGSHYLPIETGRWCRKQRDERLCTNCGTIGDEEHVIYHCSLIDREGIELTDEINDIWRQPEIYELFKRLKDAKYL